MSAEPSPGEPGAGRAQPSASPRRPRRIDYALRRLRENWLLRGSVVLTFLCYGGLLALLVTGRLPPTMVATLALLSLSSWCCVLWWFPVLEDTIQATRAVPGRAWIGLALEAFAIGAAALVHLLLAALIVIRARA